MPPHGVTTGGESRGRGDRSALVRPMDPHPRPVSIVTGATSGIGRAVAQGLGLRPGTVVVVGRDPDRTAKVVRELEADHGPARFESAVADLARVTEVHRLADELLERFPRMDVLVNNAGAYFARRELTEEGHERTWALNVLAPFLLTHRLLPRLSSDAPTRVVNVASQAHSGHHLDLDDLEGARRFGGYRQYGRSKLALVLLTYAFAERLSPARVTVNALHPGFVRSGFGQNNGGGTALVIRVAARLFGISPAQGARTILYLATSPDVAGVTGRYFSREREVRSTAASYDPETRARLWEACARATGIPVDALAGGPSP